jgi:hypothetical protein
MEKIVQEEAEEEEEDEGDTEDPLDLLEGVEGRIGKAPVFLKCELCGVVLASILTFTRHMKREHRDSDLERNKVSTVPVSTYCNDFRARENFPEIERLNASRPGAAGGGGAWVMDRVT